jgi:PAS domain S-box-containing protein
MKSEQAVITKFASHTGPPEFTCRKNWSQNILEKLGDLIHVLSSDFNILYCSLASRRLLGYQPAELVSHHFTEYIHVDDLDIFKRGFRAAQTNSSIMRVTYRFLRKDSKYIALETRRHFFKQGFFGSTRSISTERVRMMDTFLDYKTENEMLKRKIAIANHYSEGTSNSNPSSSVYTQDVLNTYALSESISLLIGLHFDLGEHSCGISMGVEGKLFNTFSKESETLKPVKKVSVRIGAPCTTI